MDVVNKYQIGYCNITHVVSNNFISNSIAYIYITMSDKTFFECDIVVGSFRIRRNSFIYINPITSFA